MSPEDHEWSRHYDTMQWTVCGILLSAIGAVYLYSLDHYHLHVAVGGALLTLASVYFSASFRRLRARAQATMTSEEERVITNPGFLRQWPVNIGIHTVLYVAWLRLIWFRQPDAECILVGAGLTGFAFIIACYINSDDPKKGQ